MKAGLLCFAGLSAVAVAQPHRRHHHPQREVATDVVTDVATATAVQNVMVYVDEDGKPTSTSFPGAAPSSSSEAAAEKYGEHSNHHTYAPPAYSSSATSSSSSVYVAPTTSTSSSTSVSVAPSTTSIHSTTETPKSVSPISSITASTSEVSSTTEAPATYSKASSTSSAAASTSSSSSSGSGLGLTYSPYKADGTCKSTDEVATDFEQLDGYSVVRLYGTDCNQVANVLAVAKPKGMKLFAGVYDIDAVVSELTTITSAANGDWSAFDTISIGNELVNSGSKTVGQIAAAVTVAKAQLLLAGYTGSVVTVDTFVAIIANPDLCEVGDYVAANCHAFFDGGVTAEQAGEFVLGQTQRVSAACGGKKTVITESGWPSQGDSNSKAVPSESNQKAAISSLQSSFSSGLYLFNAYNDMWKKDTSATFGCERYWGIYGMSAAN